MSELLLTMDTSSTAMSIAVSRGESLLAETLINVPGAHADRLLLPALSDLLHALELKPADFNAFAVVVGPGAFTGLRVGLSTVKGMAIASGGALIGVSSLRTLAMQAAASRLPVCALLDARKQEVYAAFYRFENGLPEPMGEEVVVKPEVLLNQLKGEHIFLGSGASAYRSLIVERLGARAHFVAWPSQTTRASHAAALALADLRRGHTLSAAQLLPHYIRRSEAEMLYNRGDLEASL